MGHARTAEMQRLCHRQVVQASSDGGEGRRGHRARPQDCHQRRGHVVQYLRGLRRRTGLTKACKGTPLKIWANSGTGGAWGQLEKHIGRKRPETNADLPVAIYLQGVGLYTSSKTGTYANQPVYRQDQHSERPHGFCNSQAQVQPPRAPARNTEGSNARQ